MRHRLWLVPALVLLASCSGTAPAPIRYALLYGVSLYVDGRGEGFRPNLSYCDDDAEAMAELLRAENVDTILRTDSEATKENLLGDLEYLAGIMRDQDMLIVYFSGHGGMLEDFQLDQEATTAQGYPWDSEWIFLYGAIDPALPTSYITPDAIDLSRGIYDEELDQALSAVATPRKLVIIDACNSGGFIAAEGADIDSVPPRYQDFDGLDRAQIFAQALSLYVAPRTADTGGVSPGNALVLTAAGAAEFGYETTEYAHGVFTYFLLEAAELGDLNGDGAVTAVEAYSYARAGILLTWNDDWSDTPYVFHPHLSGGPVDLVLFTGL